MSKLTQFEKNKIRKNLDAVFGKSNDPDREAMKEKIFRGLIGDYTDEELKQIEEEQREYRRLLEEETISGYAPAEESVVIYGKQMSAECIENDE